jgi:hypothetical protein
MALAREADFGSDIRERLIGASQPFLGPLNATLKDVLVRWSAEIPSEHTEKVARADFRLLGEGVLPNSLVRGADKKMAGAFPQRASL